MAPPLVLSSYLSDMPHILCVEARKPIQTGAIKVDTTDSDQLVKLSLSLRENPL